MPDPREPLGRLVHDIRLATEAERATAEGRPRFFLGSWEERSGHQRELDRRIGAAVAQYVTAAAEATLGELRQTVGTFLTVRGEHAGAADLAEGLRQILDRKSSSEGESRA